MFKRLQTSPAGAMGRGDDPQCLSFSMDGHLLEARHGDTVAAALMIAGVASLRDTPVSGSPRGPFCLMGSCFDCLVEIDGIPNRQACMVEVTEGMTVRRQAGAALLSVATAAPAAASQAEQTA